MLQSTRRIIAQAIAKRLDVETAIVEYNHPQEVLVEIIDGGGVGIYVLPDGQINVAYLDENDNEKILARDVSVDTAVFEAKDLADLSKHPA